MDALLPTFYPLQQFFSRFPLSPSRFERHASPAIVNSAICQAGSLPHKDLGLLPFQAGDCTIILLFHLHLGLFMYVFIFFLRVHSSYFASFRSVIFILTVMLIRSECFSMLSSLSFRNSGLLLSGRRKND